MSRVRKIAGTISKVTKMRYWDKFGKKIEMAQMSLEYSVSSLNNSLTIDQLWGKHFF